MALGQPISRVNFGASQLQKGQDCRMSNLAFLSRRISWPFLAVKFRSLRLSNLGKRVSSQPCSSGIRHSRCLGVEKQNKEVGMLELVANGIKKLEHVEALGAKVPD